MTFHCVGSFFTINSLLLGFVLLFIVSEISGFGCRDCNIILSINCRNSKNNFRYVKVLFIISHDLY